MPEGSPMSQEDFTLAMEQKLLHHYLLSHPDPRVVNETLTAGHLAEHNYHAYAVYMAFRYEDKTFLEEEETNTPPFSLREASQSDTSTSSTQSQPTNKSGLV